MAITTPIRIRKVPQPKVRIRVLPKIIPADGKAATIAVGTVTTLAAGSDAIVVNSGSENAAVFDFGIPRGAQGDGDMHVATYDPQEIGGDAFDVDNHTDGTTNKVFTATMKDKLDAAVVSPDDSAPRLVALTQTEYDALDPVDASTVYIIKSDA